MSRNWVALAFVAAVAAALVIMDAGAGTPLKVGDKAPPVAAAKWLGGDAVDPSKPDGRTVYVVEFWATWCPPCKESIPHLGKLQEKYRDRGLVIVGVTAEDAAKVEPFFKKAKMAYRVAIDDNDGTHKTYMEGVEGIPHAFVVDAEGKIAWSGHPLDGLDRKLEEILPKAE